MLPRPKTQLDEKGFASIVIALVLIIILALLTVGFAQLARREQQDALDKQLTTQASYAAESGINDAYQAIRNGTITDATTGVNQNKCISWNGMTPSISSQYGVSYTCVIVNLDPSDLNKNPLPFGQAWTISFSTTGGGALNSFEVHWSSTSGKTGIPTASAAAPAGFTPKGLGFTPSGSWGNNVPAVLQFSLTPLSKAQDVATDRNALADATLNAYLYPFSAPGSLDYSSQLGQVPIVSGGCNAGNCTVTVSGLSNADSNPGASYLLHIFDYYDTSNVTIDNASDGTNQLKFHNSQAIIDVTGQAHNVLKRLEETIPVKPTDEFASYSLEGEYICKRFTTDPVSSPNSQIDPSLGTYSACDPNAP